MKKKKKIHGHLVDVDIAKDITDVMDKMKDAANHSIVNINKLKLDEELEIQTKLYSYYAHLLADAEGDVNDQDAFVDLTKAEVEIAVRKHPKDYELPANPKEALVKAAVLCSDEYQLAIGELHRLKRIQAHLKADVRACEHRKGALEELVYLWGQDYFSKPRIKTNESTRDKIHENRRSRAFSN